MKELNDNFEKQWREEFQEAERAPAASVWDKIDANLAGGLVDRYKRKLFYYKIAVAASVFFALLFGSYSLYTVIRDTGSSQLVQVPQSDEDELSQQLNMTDMINQEASNGSAITSTQESGTEGERVSAPEGKADSDSPAVQNVMMGTDKRSAEVIRNGRTIPDNQADHYALNIEELSTHFNIPDTKPDRKYFLEKKLNPYDQPTILALEDDEEKIDTKRLWAGINVSSGFFDPNISYGGPDNLLADASPNTFGSVERIYSTNSDIKEQSNSIMSYKPEESSYKSDYSISYGVEFGYKFSKRFVILGGMDYQHNYGSTSVNTYVESTGTHTKYANHAIVIERASPESGLDTYSELGSEVELNSIFEFVTIPVNIGYYIIDRKFKWMMTAGLSTDIFIRNSISDSQNIFDEIQYKTGESSPYNPLYFNGKVGTMLHYKFLRNYQISLEPSFRLGLTDLTKENATFSSRPSSFLVTAGISYVF